MTEESPLRPVGEYEVTKCRSDELVLEAAERGEIFCTILRPSNVFGPGMPNQSLRGLISIVRRGLFFYAGARGAIATYIHVDDVVEALLMCGECRGGETARVYNVSHDCLWEDLIDAIASACAVRRPTLRVPEKAVRAVVSLVSRIFRVPLTQSRIDALVCRTSYPVFRISDALGFKPRCDVPRTIEQMIKDS